MVLIHRVIRREFGQLPRLFRSAANDRARSEVIGAHAREMLRFLHTHHTGEDELLFPLLRERAALDPELMDRMDAQHVPGQRRRRGHQRGAGGVDSERGRRRCGAGRDSNCSSRHWITGWRGNSGE
jgi:hypothetical protein